ncbi:hypothetical protein LZZ85_25860 [Terrimonas sp. NA20]|uniref:Peptidase S74 domain-containing protein n=1 Tax=Terrimonas ginsenosidimutans TaxID=2908004 RepID=A0ABS9KZU8_9BACT|nr:hypothetical protein [Terrimonas ginsenosidimutans]MCG2617754.1 hypothetical protein [Terrimonas ginsenosidimutans]
MKKSIVCITSFLCIQAAFGQWSQTLDSPAGLWPSPNGTVSYQNMLKFNLPAPNSETGSLTFLGSDGNYSNGMGFITGWNIASPIVWMYGYDDRNSFTVARKGWGGNQASLADYLTPLFQVRATGNVGIGVTNPAYKLTVDGTISGRKVRVTQESWADFVFEDNYKLPSLEDVREFIRKNKHLPEVPSEKEVRENGVDLGGMDAILLRKIEELTLYLIEIKEENKKLNDRLKQLEEKTISR